MDHLQELAQAYGVQLAYYNIEGHLIHASTEALLRIVQALGAELHRPEDAAAALAARRESLGRRIVEPVLVAWDGVLAGDARVQVPSGSRARFTVTPESGAPQSWEESSGSLRLPAPLPPGYHRLTVECGSARAESLIIAAPVRAYEPEGKSQHSWGVFLPLYALHSGRSWGAGDFADLEALIDWVTELGGGLVATLPLLAAFLDEPFEPGPYSPASRLMWNEFYIPVERVPELARCPAAQTLLASAEFRAETEALRAEPLVDYRRQMALKRRVLAELARTFFAKPSERTAAFRRFVAEHPAVEDYARFRAVGERRRQPWPTWPGPLRDGVVQAGDYDVEAEQYHLYVQWVADEQLQSLAARASRQGPGLYIDLPLGVNPDSYDVWREREAFALGMAAGAPPDPFFAKGQNWGFSPLHPERVRTQGYHYLRAYVRHHARLAGVLRIDHMMGLHRLYWIPHGMEAREGVYVQYPAEELYALFSLESHRHSCVLVGEDLGTVPPEVPPAMNRHNVRRMYVLQYELRPDPNAAIQPVIPGSVASLNTHDMPPFAAFFEGLDVQERIELGILDQGVGDAERRRRRELLDVLIRYLRAQGQLRDGDEVMTVLRACLRHLASDGALVALANLEDLWQEKRPQNVPGTWREVPNWRRKARYPLEVMTRMPEVVEALREIDRCVRGRGG
jgi:4-alpha-glucanotransferase